MQRGRQQLGVERQCRADRDVRLIADYRSGRSDAFDALVLAYQPTVNRVLAQLNVRGADAEDLAQETFVRVYRNLHHFREQSSFSTWLYRIVVNVVFDHGKKCRRADVRLQRLHRATMEGANLRIDRDDPFEAAFERLTAETFSRAIATLPETFRDVVALREVDDLSYEEIARQTGVSIGTVRSRLSRARARLRHLLHAQVDTGTAA